MMPGRVKVDVYGAHTLVPARATRKACLSSARNHGLRRYHPRNYFTAKRQLDDASAVVNPLKYSILACAERLVLGLVIMLIGLFLRSTIAREFHLSFSHCFVNALKWKISSERRWCDLTTVQMGVYIIAFASIDFRLDRALFSRQKAISLRQHSFNTVQLAYVH